MDFEINWGHTKLRLSNRRFITQWMEMNGKSVESFIESVSDDERFFFVIYLFIYFHLIGSMESGRAGVVTPALPLWGCSFYFLQKWNVSIYFFVLNKKSSYWIRLPITEMSRLKVLL